MRVELIVVFEPLRQQGQKMLSGLYAVDVHVVPFEDIFEPPAYPVAAKDFVGPTIKVAEWDSFPINQSRFTAIVECILPFIERVALATPNFLQIFETFLDYETRVRTLSFKSRNGF
jgi:hypothetical protein